MTIAAERAAAIVEALTWVDTPFHHGDQRKGLGVDCAHLLVAAFGELVTVDVPLYSPDWFLHQNAELLIAIISSVCVEIEVPEPADIAVFRFGRAASHAGMIVESAPLRMVHAYRPHRGVRVDEIGTGSGLASRLHSYWRLARWVD